MYIFDWFAKYNACQIYLACYIQYMHKKKKKIHQNQQDVYWPKSTQIAISENSIHTTENS